MSKRSKLKGRILSLILVCALAFQFCATESLAATKSWGLRYVYGAPTSEYVSSWSKSVTTTKKTTKVTVDKVGGNAEIFAYSSNGISALFSKAGTATTTTKVGKSVYLSVNYSSYGSYTNTPNGNFSY
jgi:hypothetical protein